MGHVFTSADIAGQGAGPARQGRAAPGFNVYGYLSARLGLGVAGRNTATVLLERGLPTRLTDVNPGGGMQGADPTFAERIAEDVPKAALGVNIFHVNPDQILYLLDPLSGRVTIRDTLQTCVPFWELPRLPVSWEAPLGAMDAILAPTRFVESTVREALPQATVIHYPQTVHLPEGVGPARAAFGLPEEAAVFVMSFDMRSDIERKNPWAAIAAFELAFPQDPDVRLVIKANNVDTAAGLRPHLARLRAAASDERVVVLDGPMSYREIVTLYASSDVVVSLHRAEGLGLSLLEGMSLGKPVVATGWSGNMDFMTDEDSFPIAFDMVDVNASTQPAYGKAMSGRQQWAEPRVEEAARVMRALAEDPGLRTAVGGRARESARRIQAAYDRGEVFDRLLELAPSAEKQRRMQALSRAFYWNYGRRVVRAGWRRAKAAVGL
jgi:glycosyltransferase involved in cell wall biosynthesis